MKRIISISFVITFLLLMSIALSFANDQNISKAMDSDWVNTAFLFIGLVLFGWYQKYQIGILRKELDSQKSIISSLNQYKNIIDLNKLDEYVKIIEKTTQKKGEMLIFEAESKFAEDIKKLESEKTRLSLEIQNSNESIEEVKSKYSALTNRSIDIANLFLSYRKAILGYEFLNAAKTSLFIFSEVLLMSKNIESKVFSSYYEKIFRIDQAHANVLSCMDHLKIEQIDEAIEIPSMLKNYDYLKISNAASKIIDVLNNETKLEMNKMRLVIEQGQAKSE